MGTRLIQLIQADPALRLGAAIDRADHPAARARTPARWPGSGRWACRSRRPLDPGRARCVIDFSSARRHPGAGRACAPSGIPLVVGTTGFEPEQKAYGLEAGRDRIPLLISPNLSRAVNLLMRLAGEAARCPGRLRPTSRSSSGTTTSRRTPRAAPRCGWPRSSAGRSARDRIGSSTAASGQVGERPRGEIGLHALRTGDNPGEHTVVFGLMGECLELSHRALNRDGFALGALDAAKFLAGKPAAALHDGRPARLSPCESERTGGEPDVMAVCEQGYLCEVCGGDVADLDRVGPVPAVRPGRGRPGDAARPARAAHPLQPDAGAVHRGRGFEPVVGRGAVREGGARPRVRRDGGSAGDTRATCGSRSCLRSGCRSPSTRLPEVRGPLAGDRQRSRPRHAPGS